VSHLVVVQVDTFRYLEQSFGDTKALACRHGINGHQSGSRATIAGDDDFTFLPLLDGRIGSA
jgi:hypothetical protein